ncbi:ABC transporter ATP-binding protein, partial [Romboutsia timonensis]
MHIQMNSYHNKEKLILSNVSKSYNNTLVLEDINIKVNEGELVTILGPSGSGKSTIFNIITNLTQKDNGNVYIDGKISYMQQKDLLLPYKTIIDNVSLPLILNKENKKNAQEIVRPYFKEFGLEGYEDKYPSELSGGMKQRANFLRTFINSNDLMLLDEPFGALDSITKTNMQKWLLNVREKFNSTIILITHDIEEAITLSDRIYLISQKPSSIKA